MTKVYERTEDSTTTHVSVSQALAEVNHAMMEGKRDVRRMNSSRGNHFIEYKDGRTVRLVEIDAPVEEPTMADVKEWHGTASNSSHMHRFTEDNRARCNRRIRANERPPVGGEGEWGVFKRTRSEIKSSEYADLYTFCPRCETK